MAADLIIGELTTSDIVLNNTANSTSVSTGAFTVSGGVGISRNLYVGGKLSLPIRTTAITTTLDDDYIINVTSGVTINIPDATNSEFDGVQYVIIKQTGSTVSVTSLVASQLFVSSAVTTISMTGASGERLVLISNGALWYSI